MAEECVKSAHNKLEAKSNFRHEVEKTLGSVKEEKNQLAEKLKTFEQGRQSALAGLKTVEAQAEDQHKRLYTMELDLATKKAAVLRLKAELEKAKVEAQVIREAAQAVERVAYEWGVLEMEQRLAEEVAELCRDYCFVTWVAAFNSVGVPAKSELRKAEKVFYLEQIREIPTDPSSAALPFPALEHAPSVQDPLVDVRTSVGVGAGREVPPPAIDTPFEDALTIRDVISQAKVAEKQKDGDTVKAIATKEDHIQKKE